ncbi:MAG: FAD/NAD(P)-binding oxidoreductase [Solirubrobacterales bacterium]
MPSTRTVIVGSSFAGYTAALELRKRTDEDHEVVVLDPRDHFTFIPSLIWLPFGLRRPEDITFKLAPIYAKRGIRFINEAAGEIDLENRVVVTDGGQRLEYDQLLVGTGPRLAFEKIDGLGPDGGHTQSVCNLEHAQRAGVAWQEFLRDPGPVVVGTAQGGSCFGASYEFVFNAKHQIKKAGLEEVAPVTFVSSEPEIGHFGLGGVGNSHELATRFLNRLDIEGIPNTEISRVTQDTFELASGRELPFKYAMIVPPFTGVDVVAATPGLTNPMGFVPVDEHFRHPEHPEVYAAGVAIAIAPPEPTPVPAGVPKTGQMTETMAKVAARNIAAELNAGKGEALPLDELSAICVLDGGNNGVIFKAENVLARGENGVRPKAHTMAGPQAHWAKLAFERVFLESRKRGKLVL